MTESGSKQGDMFGPSKNLLSVDIKNKKLIAGGENFNIYVFDGFPTKSLKTLNAHQNFINKVQFNKDGSQFLSVSSDKQIQVYDTSSLEVVKTIDKAHGKGIIDANWIDNETIASCSTDATIKIFTVKDGAL